MIVRETETHYILINQHEHGLLSGEIAYHWGNQSFPAIPYNLVIAASLHDYSWIATDTSLPWNCNDNRPYEFSKLPDHIRLKMYQKGLDSIEKIHPYTALITSLHYCSFLERGSSTMDRFLDNEKKRQYRLKLNDYPKSSSLDLQLLRLYDNISLYLCLNKPGIRKGEEHPWYKKGFEVTNCDGHSVNINARWKNKQTVSIDPFPFSENWKATIRYSMCRKSLGKKDPDLGKFYARNITFVPES